MLALQGFSSEVSNMSWSFLFPWDAPRSEGPGYLFGFVRPSGLSGADFKLYRAYYCGLCWQLRTSYGVLARFLLNYECVLLAMLIDCQLGEEIVMDSSRCPVHPISPNPHLQTGRLSLIAASSLSVLLFELKLRDDIQDGQFGRRALLRRYKAQFERAREWLALHRFPTDQLDAEFAALYQTELEVKHKVDTATQTHPLALAEQLSRTTARGLSTVMSYTARLARQPQNSDALGLIGRDLGTLIYVLDAILDYRKDRARGNFNPFTLASQHPGATDTKSLVETWSEDLEFLFSHCVGTIKQAASSLTFLANGDLMLSIFQEGIPRTISSYYGLAKEGVFDEPYWKRLLLYSRSARKRQPGRDKSGVSAPS